jgi:glutaconate CoA-transferase, subunit A
MAEVVSLRDAVADLIHDGDTIAMEGFTHLIPFAAGTRSSAADGGPDPHPDDPGPDLRPADRRRLRGANSSSPGAGTRVSAPCIVSATRSKHGWPRPLEIEEHSHAAMAAAYHAGASGLPFAVLRGYVGTDLPRRPDHPFHHVPVHGRGARGGARLTPDVGIVHAQRADRHGNVLIEGIVGVQKEVVLASRRSIVTVEEIVDDLAPPSPNSVSCPAGPSTCRRRGARGRRALLRTRLLPARQRLLQGLGRHRAGSGDLPRMDARARGCGTGAAVTTTGDAEELMTVAASRALRNDDVCFVGIGAPSAACNLAVPPMRPTWS